MDTRSNMESTNLNLCGPKPQRRRFKRQDLIDLVKKYRLEQGKKKEEKNETDEEICRLCSLLSLAHCDPAKLSEDIKQNWLKELQAECKAKNISTELNKDSD